MWLKLYEIQQTTSLVLSPFLYKSYNNFETIECQATQLSGDIVIFIANCYKFLVFSALVMNSDVIIGRSINCKIIIIIQSNATHWFY